MQKPEKPLPTDCCGCGCFRCVYDIYLDELERYREWKDEQPSKEKASKSKPS